jgi:hypothetical protein
LSGISQVSETETEVETKKESGKPDLLNNHYKNKVGVYLDSIKQNIEKIGKLKPRYPDFNPHAWVQVQVNEGMHPQAISESLGGMIRYWTSITKGPWAYGNSIIKSKSQNYYEADHIRESKEFKAVWENDDQIGEMIRGIYER